MNPVTGKAALRGNYAGRTINHQLRVLFGFYEWACSSNLGPLVNPVPAQRARGVRPNAQKIRWRISSGPFRLRRIHRASTRTGCRGLKATDLGAGSIDGKYLSVAIGMAGSDVTGVTYQRQSRQ
ncbi:hypothetical protein ACFPJ1_21425 [Kribbella qitaiheensis]|uniref:hypothetical protein n=1 Tax=Kribbella qitaiheensis TaxID=1544730 RepID=UPI00361925FA